MLRHWRVPLMLVVGLAGGCAQTRNDQPAATQPVVVAEDACLQVGEMDFLDCMVPRVKCTFAHAVRAVGIFIQGSDVGENFDQQYQFLLDRGVVRPAWKIEPDDWIDRGTISYMLYKAMGLKGGVNMVVFASWGLGDRRYAYRELRYRKLVEPGVDYNYVSGPELVTLLSKVDNYMQDTGRYGPDDEVELGDKPHTESDLR